MKIITKGGGNRFLEYQKICNVCHAFTTIEESLEEHKARSSRGTYENAESFCGNCGAELP